MPSPSDCPVLPPSPRRRALCLLPICVLCLSASHPVSGKVNPVSCSICTHTHVRPYLHLHGYQSVCFINFLRGCLKSPLIVQRTSVPKDTYRFQDIPDSEVASSPGVIKEACGQNGNNPAEGGRRAVHGYRFHPSFRYRKAVLIVTCSLF